MVKQYKASSTVNGLMLWMAKRGWGSTQVLTTIGNRSGEVRQVPVSPIEVDGARYLVAPYGEVGWVRNARSDPEVTLQRGRKEREVRLVETTGEAAAAVVMAYYEREKFPRQYMDVPENPTTADFVARDGAFPVFRIENLGRPRR